VHEGRRSWGSEPSFRARGMLPKLVISLALGALFAWLVARGGIPLVPDAEALRAVPGWALPAYLLSLLAVHYFRASRWRFLIAPVARIPLRDVILLNWIGFFAIFALPLRLGEFARPALTKLRHGIPISVGLGTVAVERVFDGLITSLCVACALFWLPRVPTSDPIAALLPTYGYGALALFAVAFAALGMFLWQRRLAIRLTRACVGLISPRLAELLAGKVDNVASGVRSIADWRLGCGFLFESLLYWGCNALGVWVLGRACGLAMHPGHALAVMGVLAIGILLPTGPGLFGNFQLAISAALRLYFAQHVAAGEGAVFIFLLYLSQSAVMIVAGIIPLYVLKLRLGDLLVLPEQKQEQKAGREGGF
jgi:glycosyltransferase 2 family protein